MHFQADFLFTWLLKMSEESSAEVIQSVEFGHNLLKIAQELSDLIESDSANEGAKNLNAVLDQVQDLGKWKYIDFSWFSF